MIKVHNQVLVVEPRQEVDTALADKIHVDNALAVLQPHTVEHYYKVEPPIPVGPHSCGPSGVLLVQTGSIGGSCAEDGFAQRSSGGVTTIGDVCGAARDVGEAEDDGLADKGQVLHVQFRVKVGHPSTIDHHVNIELRFSGAYGKLLGLAGSAAGSHVVGKVNKLHPTPNDDDTW